MPPTEQQTTEQATAASPQSPAPPLPFNIKKHSALDDPIISLSINNPFKKILLWLNEIRKKQTTEFKVDLKIPLIAWMGFLVILFGTLGASVNIFQYFQTMQMTTLLSKSTTKSVTVILPTPIPTPILLARIGTLQAAYQLSGIIPSSVPITAYPPSPAEASAKEGHYILVTNINQLTFLIVPPGLNLTQYLNKRVLVTGIYDASKNTLQIRSDSDVEYMP